MNEVKLFKIFEANVLLNDWKHYLQNNLNYFLWIFFIYFWLFTLSLKKIISTSEFAICHREVVFLALRWEYYSIYSPTVLVTDHIYRTCLLWQLLNSLASFKLVHCKLSFMKWNQCFSNVNWICQFGGISNEMEVQRLLCLFTVISQT